MPFNAVYELEIKHLNRKVIQSIHSTYIEANKRFTEINHKPGTEKNRPERYLLCASNIIANDK